MSNLLVNLGWVELIRVFKHLAWLIGTKHAFTSQGELSKSKSTQVPEHVKNYDII